MPEFMSDVDGSAGDLLRETASRLFRDCCGSPVLRAADGGQWQADAWTTVAEAGLHRAMMPEAAGGYGVAITDALSLVRIAAQHALPLPLAETMMASWLLAKGGLPVPDGPLTVAPVRGAEAITLDRVGQSLHISGDVTRIPWGRDVSAVAVLASCAGETWIALVEPKAWSVTPAANVAHEPRDTLRFAGEVSAAAPVGQTRQDLHALGAAIRAQQLAGGLVRLTEMTTQYAQDRVQFGRPIGKFQAIQQSLATLAGQTAAACAAADLAAEAVGDEIGYLPIAAAKARAGEAASIGAGIAHQVHGAIGFTFEHSLHFITRRLWAWRDEFGNEVAWNRFLGRYMARAGADRLWPEITAA